MPHRVRAAVARAILLTLLPAVGLAWEPPADWSAVGEVATWQSYDAMFYRLRDDPVFLDRSHDRLDQQADYAKTLAYDGRLDAVGLDAWLALPAAAQAERARLAAQALEFVVRFRQRIESQVQLTRESRISGWGARVSDVTVLGDCLRRLRTAVGLDPSNPYAWHLYAWFAACVGDLDRAGGALAGAELALGRVPEGDLLAVRRGVALDRAWLAWEQGRIADAATEVARAADLGAEDFQVTLLRGLVAARSGDEATAIAQANLLRQVAVRRFPMSYRTSGNAPEINNVAVWTSVPSDFAERWIKALCWLEAGQLDMAAKSFGSYRFDDIYPQAHRFWNDAGMIYELTGRRHLALKAWDQARITTPFSPYFPYKPHGYDVGRLTGRAGDLPVYLGFDLFRIAGSRLAYAAGLVEAVEATADEAGRQALAADALDELARCEARGDHPVQAALLRGAVYHRVGDLESAVLEVQSALRGLERQGDAPGYQALLDQLADVRGDRGPGGIRAFYGQSGTSRGRWAAVQDPVAELAAARAAYAADGSDAGRRTLARLLIRAGETAEGRALVADRPQAADLELVLEADRALGDPSLALALAEDYARTGDDPWQAAGLWTLAGFICLDAGHDAAGRAALERALALDPGNHGLMVQLKLMRESAGN